MNDIILTSMDVAILNGDFVVGDATKQHQELLLSTAPGDWKQHPVVGVGLVNFIDDESPEGMLREIRQQFTKDGMRITNLKATSVATIEVTAVYQ